MNYIPKVMPVADIILSDEEFEYAQEIAIARKTRAETAPNREPEWVFQMLGPRTGWKSYDRRRV